MLGSLAIVPASSCKEKVRVPQPETMSKNGCVREFQWSADCVLKNGHVRFSRVRFKNTRGGVSDIMNGQVICFGSTRVAVNKMEGGGMHEVRFDDISKKNPDKPAYVKVLPCTDQ